LQLNKLSQIYNDYSAYHQIVTFSDFLGNFRKFSRSLRFFDNMNRNDLVVGTVYYNNIIISLDGGDYGVRITFP